MKMRHVVIAASAALFSLGALAAGQDQVLKDAATVREAQERLRSNGYAATPQGLKEFQESKGLEPHGKLDHETLAALGVTEPAASGGSSPDRHRARPKS
jgi:peptidoglycan hydrolase-like protein with peptidoglycan-binding domain